MSEPRVWLAALTLVVMAVAAYYNSFSVPFVFDDIVSIVENPAIRELSLTSILTLDQPGGLTTSGRPVVHLSLAVNYAMSGTSVWSYHATNLLVHLGAGLCLFGVVRRTLLSPLLRARFGTAALPLAWVVAALWTLHPLQTESVTYIAQRAESLGGLFYVLTLYAFLRSTETRNAGRWWAVAVLACLLGVASKEIAVSVPLIVLFYDRTFISGTFRSAWQRHRRLYLMLGGTWIVLALLVVGAGGRGGTAGFGTEIPAWSYALTQCRAILRYLWLGVWPGELILDQGVATERHLFDVLPQAMAIVGLIGGVIFALQRWPAIGFLGACFLALLAPSSSIVPIATQTVAEHRMYLPLAALLAALVAGVYRLLGVRGLWICGAGAAALSIVTVMRNRDYRSEEAIWSDTVRKAPANPRAHHNLGKAMFRAGKISESIASYDRALELQPRYAETHYNLGISLARLGRIPLAIDHYQTAIRLLPGYPEAHNNLGVVLASTGRIQDALAHYEQALAINPRFAEAHHNYGDALLKSGRAVEAEVRLKRALEIKPDYPEASFNLGNACAANGRMKEALAHYQRALTLKPDYAEAHINAGNALLALEQPTEAIVHYERGIALNPQLPDAHFNLGSVLLDLARWNEAILRFETVLRLDPSFVRAHRALGFALLQMGRFSEAIPHYERYLMSAPNDPEARAELREVRAQSGGVR